MRKNSLCANKYSWKKRFGIFNMNILISCSTEILKKSRLLGILQYMPGSLKLIQLQKRIIFFYYFEGKLVFKLI